FLEDEAPNVGSGTTSNSGATTTTTTTTATTTSGTATTTSGGTTTTKGPNDDLIGDVNVDGKVDLTDAICMNKYLAGQMTLGDQAMRNANCYQDGTPTVNENDGNSLISYVIMLIDKLPEIGQ
ncbi:MAG: dockerin type I repeat-containing protein, partial [Oscillospiraceae bacterium]|nr:dockerin type I repeat-containing protein [Oscillospiraceae bacterium]